MEVRVDLDEEQFRRRPAVITIVERLRAQGGPDVTRAEVAEALERYRELSQRTREAVLSFFPEGPVYPETDGLCPACGGIKLSNGRPCHVPGSRCDTPRDVS